MTYSTETLYELVGKKAYIKGDNRLAGLIGEIVMNYQGYKPLSIAYNNGIVYEVYPEEIVIVEKE